MKGNGIVLCSLATAGLWLGMPLPWNTSNRKNKKKKLFYWCSVINLHEKDCADAQFTL